MEVMLSNAYCMCTSETPCLNTKNMKDFREVVVDSLIGPQKKVNETTDKLSLSFCYSCYRKIEDPQPCGVNSVPSNRTKKSSGINVSDHMKVQHYALIYISSIFLSALALLLSIQITVILMMKVILKKIKVSSMDSKKLHY